MSLAPTNEESVWNARGKPVRKKTLGVQETYVYVDSFRLLTTSVRVWWRVGTN